MEDLLAKALGQDVTQLGSEEKQRLLSRLLGRLAHEIRNPLSSLDIHIQLIEEDLAQLAPEMRDRLAGRLEIISGELQRLETVVQHFLRLSAPSEVNLEKIDIGQVIQNVCALLQPEAAKRGIEIKTEMASPLPVLLGDPVQLNQALMNLIINAIQAVEHDGKVQLQAKRIDSSIIIMVHDTGPGIAAEKIPDIFEPYFTTKPEGNGLGLWIAQQIATAHRGEIRAANAPGGGAIFTLRLPIPTETLTHG
jgi:signal transduction histidine kinase